MSDTVATNTSDLAVDAVDAAPGAAPIVFFDGVCNVCAASVHFVLDHERDATLRFASLQGETAKRMLPPLGIDPSDLDSVVIVEGGRAYGHSTAALRTTRYLRLPWRWMPVFLLVPRFIRDAVYGFIARNRYRWFGKKDACLMPTPALKARFLP